jgi:hypothetical protein
MQLAVSKGSFQLDKLLNHSHGLMLERIGHAVAALGTDRFHACLLRILDCLIASDIRLVLRYSRHAKPVYLVNEGLPRAAVDLYLAGYYQFDPAQELWRSGKNISVISFRDLSEELYRSSTEYFSVYAPRVNIADDLGMFMPGIGGAAVAIFLERRRSRFSPEDAATMRLVYPMFCDLYRAHLNSFFGTIMTNEPSTASPEVSRAFIVLDAEGRKIYASPAWNNAELTLGDEITAGKDLLRAKNNAVATIADGLVLHAERLHSTFPLAPDGYLYVLEHDVRMLGSMDFEGAIAKFWWRWSRRASGRSFA